MTARAQIEDRIIRKLTEVVPRITGFMRSEAKDFAPDLLTVTQLRVLGQVERGMNTNSQLAEALGMTAPGVSRLVDTLVTRGYLTRSHGTVDRRKTRLRLSSKGIGVHRNMLSYLRSGLKSKLRGLAANDRRLLLSGLSALEKLFIL